MAMDGTMKNTKAQLLTIIEEKEKMITSLSDEIQAMETVKAYKDYAEEVRGIFDNFKEKGFTHEEALELTRDTVNAGSVKPTMPYRSYRRPISYPRYN